MAVLLAVTQVVLPGVAASTVRNKLAGGTGIQVTVKAFPALELLWHDIDTLDVSMSTYDASQAKIGSLLSQAGGVGTLHVAIGTFTSGLVTVHDVTAEKHGDQLTAIGTILDSDLQKASGGILRSVTPVSSSGGQLVLQGTALSGAVTVDLVVRATDGKIVATPQASGLLGLATDLIGPITVFSNAKVTVDSLQAHAVTGGFVLRLTADLH